jgi:hypothetical protein
MTIEVTESPDALQCNGIQAQNQAADTTILITEAEVVLGTAAATGVRGQEHRWVALLSSIFAWPKKSRPRRHSYPPTMAYLDRARMAREMDRL